MMTTRVSAPLAEHRNDAPGDLPQQGPYRRPARGRSLDVGSGGWLLATYVALLPIQFGVLPERRIAPSDLFLLAYLVGRGSRLTWRKRDWTGWHALVLFVLAFGAIVAELNGQFDTSAVGQKLFGLLFLYLSLFALLDFLTSLERVRWLLAIFIQSVALNTLVFLALMLLQNLHVVAIPSLNMAGARLSGLLIDPNAFGGLLVVALFLVLASNEHMQLIRRRWTGPLGVLLSIGVMFTFSRSAWIGFAMALGVGFALQPRRFAGLVRRAIPVLVVGGVLLVLTVLPSVTRLSARTDQVAGRVDIIQESVADFLTAPVTGIGLGAANVRHGRIIHNTPMFFLTELGPLGLAALLGLVGFYVMRALQAARGMGPLERRLPHALLMGHAAMFGVSLGIEATYQRHWWLLFACISATYGLAAVPASAPALRRSPAHTFALNPLLLPGRLALVAPAPSTNGRMLLARTREVLRPGASQRGPEPAAPLLTRPSCRVGATVDRELIHLERSASGEVAPLTSGIQMPASQPALSPRLSPAETRGTLFSQAALGVVIWVSAVLAARSASPGGLGSLAFVLVLFGLAAGAWRSLHADGSAIGGPSGHDPVWRWTARALGATWLVGLVLGTVCVVAGALASNSLGSGLQVLGVALPFLLTREAGRSSARWLSQPAVPVLNDLAWAALLTVALVIAAAVGDRDGWMYLAGFLGSGAVAGMVVLRQLRVMPDVTGGAVWLRQMLPARATALVRFTISAGLLSVVLLVMPLLSNLGELGAVSAACITYAPFVIVLQMISLLLQDRMATMNFDPMRAGQLSIVLGGLAVLWCAVVAAMPSGLGRWLVGDTWVGSGTSRQFIGLALIAYAAGRGPALALRLRGLPAKPTSALTAAAGVAFVGALVAVAVGGAPAAAAAIFVSQLMGLAVVLYQLRKLKVFPGEEHDVASPYSKVASS